MEICGGCGKTIEKCECEKTASTHSAFEMELPPETESSGDFVKEQETVETVISSEGSETVKVETYGAESIRGVKSKSGELYDPAIHQFPAKETGTGKWRRKHKSKLGAASEVSSENLNGEVELDTMPNERIRLAAQNAANIYGALHVPILGIDAAPDDSSPEYKMLQLAIETYFQQTGIKELPPGLNVIFNMGNYSMMVAKRPKVWPVVVERFKPVWDKMKKYFTRGKNAQPDSGEKRER